MARTLRVRPGQVQAALEGLGVEYEIRGEEAVFLCPYHVHIRYRLGSFSISTRTGLFNCFSCGASGNLATLVAHLRRIDVQDAQRWVLRQRAKFKFQAEDFNSEPAVKAKLNTAEQINEASLALFTDPPAEELRKRNLTLEACRELGVLWDPDKRSWIIPFREPYTGKLMGWQAKRRSFVKNHPKGVDRSTTLFGLQLAVREGCSRLVLVESPLDVCRLRSAGVRGGVSSFGVQYSDPQLDLITEFARSLVLALDNDPAGLRATRRLVAGYTTKSGRHVGPYRRVPVAVWDYGPRSPRKPGYRKDPGDQTDEEIRASLENAIPSLLWK